jgi:hypothetical protein
MRTHADLDPDPGQTKVTKSRLFIQKKTYSKKGVKNHGLAVSLVYPSGDEGGNFLVQSDFHLPSLA